MVCTKTLYNYVDNGLISIKNIDLPEKPRRNTKERKSRENKRRLGDSIEIRPEEIENREGFYTIGRRRKCLTRSLTEFMYFDSRLRLVLSPVGATPLPPEELNAAYKASLIENIASCYCNLRY